MYRIRPYNYSVNTRDVFDLFEDFFKSPVLNEGRRFRVDIENLKDKYIVEAELPGVSKDDINIKYDNETLIINISKEVQNEEVQKDYSFRERQDFVSERRFNVPDVDPNNFTAKLEGGILTITLNKLEHKVNTYTIDID